MSSQPKLALLSSDFLNSIEALKFLPELLLLKTTVEKNIAHNSQTVFDHTVAVMAGLEKFFNEVAISSEIQPKLSKYLDQKIGNNSKKDLLKLLVLVHDLAKPLTLVTNSAGNTSCPGHEILAAARVGEFKDRFGLEQVEINYVQQLVRLHGTSHELLTTGLASNSEQQLELIHQFDLGTGGLGIELIIMVYSDINGGDYAKFNADDFSARLKLCQNWLFKLVQDLA